MYPAPNLLELHVYVDDLIVKSKKHFSLLDDLQETFANLREYKVWLNPEKCVFGVPVGELLGFFMSAYDIEANLEKIKAIERMHKLTKLHGIQKFADCLASLSWFVSRLGEKVLPLYELMKRTTKFEWTKEVDEAFCDLKRALSSATVLAAPAKKEPMLAYIVAAT